jgi:hypothetical protein
VDTYTAWSNDGKWLAYVRSGPSKVDVGIVAIENPKPRIIYTLNGVPGVPWSAVIWNVCWLLDGNTILAQAYDDEQLDRILVISVEQGLIKSVPLALYDLSVSPDGRYMANRGCYTRATGSCITVHRVVDFQLISTLPDPKLNMIVGWTPQGDSLVFSSERGGPVGLWRQRLNEGRPDGEAELLKSGIGEFFSLGIDRVGRIYSILRRVNLLRRPGALGCPRVGLIAHPPGPQMGSGWPISARNPSLIAFLQKPCASGRSTAHRCARSPSTEVSVTQE